MLAPSAASCGVNPEDSVRLAMFPILAASLLLAVACGSGSGGDGDGPASTTRPDHCGTVTEDETWGPDLNPHTVSCVVHIEGGSVTIAAGTEVLFTGHDGLGSGIYLSEDGGGGTLHVEGTAADPVLLHGDLTDPGNWNGIKIWGESADAVIAHAEIDGAGGYDANACVTVDEGATLTVQDVVIRNCEDAGLHVEEEASFGAGSRGLALLDSQGPAAMVYEGGIGTFPWEDLEIAGNESDGVRIGRGHLNDTITWPALGYPWYLDTSIEIDASTAPTVTIEPGAELRFSNEPSDQLLVSHGTLEAIGTEELPIVIGSASEQAGSWDNVSVGDLGVATLEFVDLGHGGGWGFGSIYVDGGTVVVRDSHIHDSADCGLEYDSGALETDRVTYANNAGGDYCE
jgi:hypothetical protein